MTPSNEFAQLPRGAVHDTEPIAVAEKIIADISTGIYRTPAAALKELVSNAYDADATEVTISTGAPEFDRLVIKDNGAGMTLERFRQVISHIGGSWKRLDSKDGITPVYDRPIIGRIGIGLLAIAQLGQRFYVASTVAGDSTRFLAEIDLSPFHKDDAALHVLDGQEDSDRKVEIGHIKFVGDIPEAKSSQFTVITVPDPKKGLVSEMHGQLRDAIGADPDMKVGMRVRSFQKIIELTYDRKRASAALDGYFHLLWELGLLAPVDYVRGGPFQDKKREIENLDTIYLPEAEKFKVTVDQFDIRRPILFPNPCAVDYGGPDPIIYPLDFSRNVAKRNLCLYGYIYAQKPHIDPVELQGLQIRIRGVGIGGFDRTWLGYPFDEGLKFGQITGELFVTEGLESALNIDRASFRETDPHYLALRAYIWNFLRSTVFPDFKSRQKKHRKQKQSTIRNVKLRKFEEVLADAPEPLSASAHVKSSNDTHLSKSDYQSLVTVEQDEIVIAKEVFDSICMEHDLSRADKDRLQRVCITLAAFGIWDEQSNEDASILLRALAIAVST